MKRVVKVQGEKVHRIDHPHLAREQGAKMKQRSELQKSKRQVLREQKPSRSWLQ
jgi:hypothetical protein